jgi:hypothetical protein
MGTEILANMIHNGRVLFEEEEDDDEKEEERL